MTNKMTALKTSKKKEAIRIRRLTPLLTPRGESDYGEPQTDQVRCMTKQRSFAF